MRPGQCAFLSENPTVKREDGKKDGKAIKGGEQREKREGEGGTKERGRGREGRRKEREEEKEMEGGAVKNERGDKGTAAILGWGTAFSPSLSFSFYIKLNILSLSQ